MKYIAQNLIPLTAENKNQKPRDEIKNKHIKCGGQKTVMLNGAALKRYQEYLCARYEKIATSATWENNDPKYKCLLSLSRFFFVGGQIPLNGNFSITSHLGL